MEVSIKETALILGGDDTVTGDLSWPLGGGGAAEQTRNPELGKQHPRTARAE